MNSSGVRYGLWNVPLVDITDMKKKMLIASVWADYSSVLHVKLIHIWLVLCMAFNMKPGRDSPVHLVSKPLYEWLECDTTLKCVTVITSVVTSENKTAIKAALSFKWQYQGSLILTGISFSPSMD